MKAAICERYGPPDVVEIREVPKPEPKANEVLIRMRASTVEIADARLRGLRVPPGMSLMVRMSMGWSRLKQPVLGMELAGDVEAVGSAVTRFKPGDKVFGTSVFDFGCHAEYVCLPADSAITHMPDGLSYEEAAALGFGGTTAQTFFRCAKLKVGEHILINGASGSVGTAAVQLAKHHGAEVTGVCSGANADLVASLGADRVIDYTKQDFTQAGETYDLIMDCHGNAPYPKVKHLLNPGGRYLMVIPASLWRMIVDSRAKQVITGEEDGGAKTITAETVAELADLAAKGVFKPVIDSTYEFERIIEAYARVDTGHKRGSVVITFPE